MSKKFKLDIEGGKAPPSASVPATRKTSSVKGFAGWAAHRMNAFYSTRLPDSWQNEEARKALLEAKSFVDGFHPFIGSLLSRVSFIEATGKQLEETPTMKTNGEVLLYNPAFYLGKDVAERRFLLAHEAMHCVYKHHLRRNGRDKKLWNVACDFVVNRDLAQMGFRVPQDAIFQQGLSQELSAEELYRMLEQKGGMQSPQVQQQKQQGRMPGSGDDPGGSGGVDDYAEKYEGVKQAKGESAWTQFAEEALQAMKDAKKDGLPNGGKPPGKLPGNIERLLNALTQSKIDWKTLLARFAERVTKQDYTWMRPNRRFIGMGINLPSFVVDSPSHIVCIVDTSGSIQQHDLKAFRGELQEIIDCGVVERLTVIDADTQVNQVEEYQANEPIKAKFRGGGGTDFRASFDWVRENAPHAQGIIYMTDCYVHEWGTPVDGVPTLWLVTGNDLAEMKRAAAQAPFGKAIFLEHGATAA